MIRKCRKYSIKTGIHNNGTDKDSEKKCRECWEYNVQTGKEGGWIE
jgi:hypothetical protein